MPVVNPGIRRLLASAIQRLFNGASFSAPLTHSAIPTRAASGTTATFTRATTATFTDFEGVLRTAPAGCARFQGARFVRNLITKPEALDNASWTKANLSVTTGQSDQAGGTTAFKLVESSGASVTPQIYETGNATSGTTCLLWCIAKAGERNWLVVNNNQGSGGGSIRAWFNLSTGAVGTVDAGGAATIDALGDGWYLCSLRATIVGGSSSLHVFQISNADNVSTYAGDGTSGLYIWHPQLEDITGRADQTTPSEYVSVGVLSAPYHGSGVDGVKCFPTDLSGNQIPSITLLGYQAQGARTNLCLQSQTFDNASWSVLDATVTANQAVAPDGTTTADLLAEAATTAIHIVYPTLAITVTAGSVYTASVYAKAGTRSWLCVYEDSGGGTIVWFDLANGAVGTTAAATATIESAGSGWYRCAVTYTQSGAAARIRFAVASGNGVASHAGAITNNIYLWGAQVELGSFASSYIATTTAAVTRNADVLTYSSAGNIDGTKGWAYAEVTTEWASGTSVYNAVIGSYTSSVGPLIGQGNAPTEIRLRDGTNSVSSPAFTSMATGSRKVASTWGGSDAKVTASGLTPTSGSFDGDMGFTNIPVGCTALSDAQWYGTIRNVRIGQRQLSASELGAITS